MTTTTLTTDRTTTLTGGPAGRTIRVALAGCGTVGGELVRLLDARGPAIARGHGLRVELASVLVRDAAKPRPEPLPPGVLTTDVDAFLAADADLVVEVIGGLDTAGRIAAAALERGRALVTANKALVADRGPTLDRLARDRGGALFYEAAVAGGVPVVATLRDALRQTDVRALRGILNGTTNYLLGRMAAGVGFEAALREARELGYAEADATRDLDGQDAADKIAILAWIAFGADPTTLAVHRRGLLPRPDRLAADATAFHGVPRLLAECVAPADGAGREAGEPVAVVEPVVVPPHSLLARTAGADNLLEVETAHSGTIRLSGPGAGGAPTASAVLSDLLRAAAATGPAGPAADSDAICRPPSPHPRFPGHRGHAGPAPRESWIISARRPTAGPGLVTALRRHGVEPETVLDDDVAGLTRVRTARCPRDRIRGLEGELERRGLEPVVSRCFG